MKGITHRYERIIGSISRVLNFIGAGAVLAMALLICFDVILRSAGLPIQGSYDLVRFLAIIVVAFSLAYTQVQRGHIFVELVVSRLPHWARAVLSGINSLLGLGIFVLLAWHSCTFAARLRLTNEVSQTLAIPIYPFVYIIALGAAILCLVLLADFFNSMDRGIKD